MRTSRASRERARHDFKRLLAALGGLLALAAFAFATGARAQGYPYPSGGISGVSSSGTSVTFSLPALLPAGTALAPSVAWADDADGTGTGLYRPAANAVGISTNGVARWSFNSSGHFAPSTNATYDLGTAALRMRFVYTEETYSGIAIYTAVVRDAPGNQRLGLTPSDGTFYVGRDSATGVQHHFATVTSVTSGSLAQWTNGITEGSNVVLNLGASQLTMTGVVSATEGVTVATAAAKPACAVGIRGRIWVTQGGAGVADVVELCTKNAADAYVWTAL